MLVKRRNAVLEKMKEVIINYSEFTRKAEEVTVLEGIVIVMGEETLKSFERAPLAGETVRRRDNWGKNNV
jgi:hypothetical protein